jgi:murein DD-endopeptidase MepM/ murein hydrolase activator NlpD
MQQLLNQLPKRHKIFITSLVTLMVLLMFIPAERANASRDNSVKTLVAVDIDKNVLEVGKSYPLEVDLAHIEEPVQDPKSEQSLRWQKVKVKNGDNLAKIFKRAGFSAQTLHKITSLGKSTKILTKIHPGDSVSFGAGIQGVLRELTYSLDQVSTLIVSLDKQNKYQTRTDTKEVEIRQQFATAVIDSNFWNAGIESGLNDSQVMNLANIFGWDIDFALDIHDGDEFSVVYEDRYIDGEYAGTGNIISAEFVNQGDNYQAVRYTDGEYYSPEGRSMRKAFLRAPVNFKYVSSSFKRRRFHPVQKRWKAHRGVDYAAKTGTPVVAAGNGKVIKAAYNKYNGNHVFIQHPNGIVTKYLHFSKRKVKKGARVKQGQLIGLVGSTGLSSGPHLHFEFIVNGVHRNPRTVKMPKAKAIAKKQKSQFLKVAKTSMAQLNAGKRVRLAFRDSDKSAK